MFRGSKDFWSFYANNIDALDFNRLSYKVESQCSLASSIIFHCYNTSWCSVLNEKPGSIILPTSAFLTEDHKGGNIVISMFHHPTGWFLIQVPEQNNKTLFEQHILKESNIVLCGHEHTINGVRVSSLKKNTDFVYYLEGGAFCDSDEHSKFNFMLGLTSNKKVVHYGIMNIIVRKIFSLERMKKKLSF